MDSDSEREVWSPNQIKLLVAVRLEIEDDYNSGEKSKKGTWKKILKTITEKDPSFPYNLEQIIRKFTNLLTTYKRIKKRKNKSGRGSTFWPYYDEFDNVYGNKHFIEPPEENLCDTLQLESEIIIETSASEEHADTNQRSKRAKTNNIEVVTDLIEEMNSKDQIRHEEFLNIERKKLEIDIEKNKIEQQKVTVLNELKDILKAHFQNSFNSR